MTEMDTRYDPRSSDPERFKASDYDSYRSFCDRNNPDFRKVGVQDEESYERVIADSRTVYMRTSDGQVIPFLSPLEFEKMYDYERCQDMTRSADIMLLCIPLQTVGMAEFEIVGNGDIGEETTIIVEAFRKGTEPDNLRFLEEKYGLHEMQFLHPDLLEIPGHEHAWMACYSLAFQPKNLETKPYSDCDLSAELQAGWVELSRRRGTDVLPGQTSTGTYVLSADQLTELPELAEELWEISESGFGKILGAHHPVSMEFNKSFFEKQINAPDTLTAIHFVEGKPVCFGFVGLSMNNNDWLNMNSPTIKEDMQKAEEHGQAYVHFYELISRGLAGMGYSKQILGTFFELARISGYSYQVFFESTNLSSTYIPEIIKQEIEGSEDVELCQDVKQLGKLHYSALIPPANDNA